MSVPKRRSRRRVRARMMLHGYLTELDRVLHGIAVPKGWVRDNLRDVWRPVVLRDWILARASAELRLPSYMSPPNAV